MGYLPSLLQFIKIRQSLMPMEGKCANYVTPDTAPLKP